MIQCRYLACSAASLLDQFNLSVVCPAHGPLHFLSIISLLHHRPTATLLYRADTPNLGCDNLVLCLPGASEPGHGGQEIGLDLPSLVIGAQLVLTRRRNWCSTCHVGAWYSRTMGSRSTVLVKGRGWKEGRWKFVEDGLLLPSPC